MIPDEINLLIEDFEKDPCRAACNYLYLKRGDSSRIELTNEGILGPHEPAEEEKFANRHLPRLYERLGIRISGYESPCFLRWAEDESEIEIARSGKLRRSRNHRTNKQEPGSSVSRTPGYYHWRNKYVYVVRGEQVGVGSDEEPLLEPTTIKVLSKLFWSSEYRSDFYELNKKIIAESSAKYPISQLDIFSVLLGHIF